MLSQIRPGCPVYQKERGEGEQPEERRARAVHGAPAEEIGEQPVDGDEHHPEGGSERDPDQGSGIRQPELASDVRDYEDAVSVEHQTLDPTRTHAQD